MIFAWRWVLWGAAHLLERPGAEGRPRDQPLAAEGLTACQDKEGWGVWGERVSVWVKKGWSKPSPQSRDAETLGEGPPALTGPAQD